MEAEVTEVAGTVTVTSGSSHASVPLLPDGETAFSLPVTTAEAVHSVIIGVDLEAALRVPIPPLVTLTHLPQRTEYRTETVRLLRPGTTETVSETGDGDARRRDPNAARRVGHALDTERNGHLSECDAHHRPPGARRGSGRRTRAADPGQDGEPVAARERRDGRSIHCLHASAARTRAGESRTEAAHRRGDEYSGSISGDGSGRGET